jgi:hypothetical protein
LSLALGRLSNPSTIVLAQTNKRLPTGTPPNSAVYNPVMSADPATGAGQTPMMRKLRHARTAEFCGGLARSTVLPPGAVGQVNLTVTTPPVLVMTRFWADNSTRRK